MQLENRSLTPGEHRLHMRSYIGLCLYSYASFPSYTFSSVAIFSVASYPMFLRKAGEDSPDSPSRSIWADISIGCTPTVTHTHVPFPGESEVKTVYVWSIDGLAQTGRHRDMFTSSQSHVSGRRTHRWALDARVLHSLRSPAFAVHLVLRLRSLRFPPQYVFTATVFAVSVFSSILRLQHPVFKMRVFLSLMAMSVTEVHVSRLARSCPESFLIGNSVSPKDIYGGPVRLASIDESSSNVQHPTFSARSSASGSNTRTYSRCSQAVHCWLNLLHLVAFYCSAFSI
ncbi:hypothetical protein SCHPADRAFT_516799 [Schizopora paradoxa]|uniref:Uncharacterized protein n=1 Tax=Schizopora paradoxa TaxID=27342 RepID=A0A0H2RFA9_9AGAM|nr:hypothetical protein SCHPADRAFT_516799 [Schizopora paradoxa]